MSYIYQVSQDESKISISEIRMAICIVVINILTYRGCYWSLKFYLEKPQTIDFRIRENWILYGHVVCNSQEVVSLYHYRCFVKFPLLIEKISLASGEEYTMCI